VIGGVRCRAQWGVVSGDFGVEVQRRQRAIAVAAKHKNASTGVKGAGRVGKLVVGKKAEGSAECRGGSGVIEEAEAAGACRDLEGLERIIRADVAIVVEVVEVRTGVVEGKGARAAAAGVG